MDNDPCGDVAEDGDGDLNDVVGLENGDGGCGVVIGGAWGKGKGNGWGLGIDCTKWRTARLVHIRHGTLFHLKGKGLLDADKGVVDWGVVVGVDGGKAAKEDLVLGRTSSKIFQLAIKGNCLGC